MKSYYDIFETELGWMGLVASERGLRRTTLPERDPEICAMDLGPEFDVAIEEPDRFEGLRLKVESYFSGEPVSFGDEAVELDDAGPFFRAAWAACRGIPRGETRTYRWLAAQAGRPAAPRAAGQAMARNRLPIVVPCHRVIASDGSLGGFGKGKTRLALKRHLLGLESVGAMLTD